MKFGLGESQMVEFSPALPNHGTVPSLRASTGTLKPNSRMLATIRSTAVSFLRGLRT